MLSRLAFRALVNNYVAYEAQPMYPASDTTDLNALINDRLAVFSGYAHCFYDDMIVCTLPVVNGSTGVQRLNCRDGSVFGQMIWEPTGLIINGMPLLDLDGKPGPISAIDLQTWQPGYLTSTQTAPLYWYTAPSTSGVDIAIWPPTDQVYPNSYAIGWTMHPALTADSGAGGTLMLPQELQIAAAKYTAAYLLDPYKAGSSAEKFQTLLSEAMSEAEKWAEKAQRMIEGNRVRGERPAIWRLGGSW